MKVLATFALLAAVAAPVRAQTLQAAPRASVITDIHDLWRTSSDYVAAAAEQMPEAEYGFKPTPDVRSFGEVINHVAASQRLLCALALGDKPNESTKTTKADLIAELKASTEYCEKAYAMGDAAALQSMTPEAQHTWTEVGFGTPKSRLNTLMTNAWHVNEHYGNVVTYMRLKGVDPPSSQPKK